MAMTGYYRTLRRPRTHKPLSMMKYDPVGTSFRRDFLYCVLYRPRSLPACPYLVSILHVSVEARLPATTCSYSCYNTSVNVLKIKNTRSMCLSSETQKKDRWKYACLPNILPIPSPTPTLQPSPETNSLTQTTPPSTSIVRKQVLFLEAKRGSNIGGGNVAA